MFENTLFSSMWYGNNKWSSIPVMHHEGPFSVLRGFPHALEATNGAKTSVFHNNRLSSNTCEGHSESKKMITHHDQCQTPPQALQLPPSLASVKSPVL
ncbi:hypothetical protein TNCV_2563121 [Trichonephila clavipes]|uniref:Uncharacterized protein n=1 Tax=Trichonephila clavipes TaxID=2585209 RepID=A0A8X6R119_TRICX|nr:hypothetical protein TNCV_2563121 [Trichonephila clavipes]